MIEVPPRPNLSQILVICGPMKSGKSKELLMQIDKLEYSKIPYVLFKPDIDSRSGSGVKTRYLNHCKESISIPIKNPKEILKHIDIENIKLPFYIVIDEAQFFDKSIVDLVLYLFSLGINFIIAGLDLDAKAKPFGPIPELLAISTDVMKLKSVCEHCFSPANFSRLKKFDPEFHKNNIKVGDENLYEVFCARCYFVQEKEESK